MSIYPASAEKATCPGAGCGCAQRAPRYPSGMTDAEWEVLGPQARAVMAELRHGPGGRPMAHRLRVTEPAVGHPFPSDCPPLSVSAAIDTRSRPSLPGQPWTSISGVAKR